MYKKDNSKIGKLGEDAATEFLKKKGYDIIQRNYRIRASEIDIIAKGDGCICFVEVKTRKDNAFGIPSEAVNRAKQHKILFAAQYYLMQKETDCDVRFDVIEVIGALSGDKFITKKINHIKNAFDNSN